jgi:hypothetical protein
VFISSSTGRTGGEREGDKEGHIAGVVVRERAMSVVRERFILRWAGGRDESEYFLLRVWGGLQCVSSVFAEDIGTGRGHPVGTLPVWDKS